MEHIIGIGIIVVNCVIAFLFGRYIRKKELEKNLIDRFRFTKKSI